MASYMSFVLLGVLFVIMIITTQSAPIEKLEPSTRHPHRLEYHSHVRIEHVLVCS
jgi:hypothetical protein